MKKILILLLCLFFSCSVFARDYTKIQEKEIMHAQQYGVNVNNYTRQQNNTIELFDNYKQVNEKLYTEKLNKDDKEYAKIKEKFETRTIDNYNAEAKGEDYYRIYRIVERLIRANRLDFMNWRIGIYRDSSNPIYGYRDGNYISIPTSLCDTFTNNDAAIAFVIAHQMTHTLFGHDQRLIESHNKACKTVFFDLSGGIITMSMYHKYLTECKKTDFAADAEALKMVITAGYSTKNAIKYLELVKLYPDRGDFWSKHPYIDKRIQNYKTAMMFIPAKKFQEFGKYNIYNSEVLQAKLSSDRESFSLRQNKVRQQDQYYHPETPQEYYLRCGYGGYVNGYYEKSCEYFEKYFKLNTSNSQAYYYASLANEQMYKNTHKNIYRTRAQNYAQKSNSLVPTKL